MKFIPSKLNSSYQYTLTIIIPVGSYSNYLKFTLDNLSNVIDSRVEILLLDNTFSSYSSLEIPLEMKNFRVERSQKRLSMSKNFFRGLNLASGTWLCFMGEDDGIITKNLTQLLDSLESVTTDVVSTHPVYFQYPIGTKGAWADIPEKDTFFWKKRIKYHPALAVLFPQFKLDLPVPYNRCVVRTSVLQDYTKNFDDLIGISHDDFLAQYIAQKCRVGTYLELPVFIHGGSDRSQGFNQHSTSPAQISLEFQNDSKPKMGFLLTKFGISCSFSLAFEHYLKAKMARQNRSNFSYHEVILSKFFSFYAEIFCANTAHHNQYKALVLFRKISSPLHNYSYRLIRKFFRLLYFRSIQPTKNYKVLLPSSMTIDKFAETFPAI